MSKLKELTKQEVDRLVQEWLSKGNKITVCEPKTVSDPESIGFNYSTSNWNSAMFRYEKAKER